MPAPPKIRVLLVDDEPAVRRGLRMRLALEPDLEVVGEAGSGPDAVCLAARMAVDVVVMDVAMPGGDGISAASALAATAPHAAVVVLSFYDDPATRATADDAGVAAFLGKHEAGHQVVETIRRVARRPPPAPSAVDRVDAPPPKG